MTRRMAVTTAALLCLGCADSAGPDRLRMGYLAFAPSFTSNAPPVVAVGGIRVTLTRLDGTVAAEETFEAQAGQTEFTLELRVGVNGPSEQFDLTLTILDSDGNPSYRNEPDPQRITVTTSADQEPIAVLLLYIGPGNSAETLEILPSDPIVTVGEAVELTVVARDATEQPVPDMPVEWTLIDPLVILESADATTPSTAVIRAGAVPGVAMVEVRDANANADTATVTVVAAPAVEVEIFAPEPGSEFVAGEEVFFEGAATHSVEGELPGSSMRWESDVDGVIGTGASITRNDLSVGPHLITLFATGSDEVQGSASVSITILEGNQPPTANAGDDQTVSDTDLNGVETVTLNGSGSSDPDGTIVTYTWVEGQTTLASSAISIVDVDLDVGSHTIVLTVTDDQGATDNDEVVVTVTGGNLPPVADAGADQTVNDADGSGAETVTLDGSASDDPDGTIASYAWSEDGTPFATEATPTVTFDVGVHTITLLVTDNEGATDTDEVVVTVQPNQGPTANAGPDQTVTDTDLSGAEVVTLDGTGSSDPDGTIASYVWTEGATALGSGAPLAVSLAVGTHTITLTVTDNGGATGTDQVVVTVVQGNLPPTANAGPDQTVSDADGTGAEPVTLDGTGSNDPDGTIASYGWTEGATALGSGATLPVSLTVGTHTITLTVTDNEGATGTDQVVVTVQPNQGPTANAGPDQTVTDTDLSGAEVVTLDGTGSSDPDGTIASYVWTEGATALGSGAPLAVSLAVGTHTITLTVTDNGGATGTDQVVVTVVQGNLPPAADAGPDQTVSDADGTGAEPVTLDGSASEDPDGTIASYGWTEGATALGSGATLPVSLTVGTHTITLTVTDNEGATGTDQVVVTVQPNQGPTANAGPDQTVTDTDLSGAEVVTLDGTGSSDPDGTIASYVWTEGATALGSGATLPVSLAVGTHTITLTVTDNGGATGTDQVVVTVEQGNLPPAADAGPDQTVSDADGTGAEPVTLDGSASEDPDGTIASYGWTEGATALGSGATLPVSLTVGTHTITLTVTDNEGATGTDQVVVTVQPNQGPTANAGPDQTVADTDLSGAEVVTLDGTGSSDPDGTIASYVWTEGATALGSGATLPVSLAVGTHTITLTVTDNGGATGTDQVVVTVEQGNLPPAADAGPDQTVSDADGTGAEPVTLDGSASEDPDGTIASYGWTEGATALGSGATLPVSLTVGTHTITLTVTDNEGATGTDQVVVTVQPNQGPTANAGPDQTVADTDLSGAEVVTLDGTGSSDPDGTIASYGWTEGATALGSGATLPVSLAVGTHTITLTVTDNGGATGTDQVVISVNPGSANLIVAGSGTGSGTVSSSPAGIDCIIIDGDATGTCSANFDDDSDVTLTATASTGGVHQFTGWSGAGIECPGAGPCSLTMDGDRTVIADFTEFHALTVLGAGTGAGTVAGGGGIDCAISDGQTQGTCGALFAEGVNVVLTATPDVNSSFVGWSGACTGTGNCSVTMTQPRTAVATFTVQQPDLVISSGTPTVTPTAVRPGASAQLSPWTVLNQGNAASGNFTNGFYLSTDATITSGDVLIGTNSNLSLAPDEAFNWGGQTLTIPANTVPGPYFIGILVDRVGGVSESNEANNFVSTALIVIAPNTPPTISNVNVELLQLNDPQSCGFQNPPGSLFRFTMDYSDPNGDVTQATAVLTVGYQFNPSGSSGQFTQPPEPGLSITGNGFSGQVSSLICDQFLQSTSVTHTFTLQDGQGNFSNTLSPTVQRPGGANSPNPTASAGSSTAIERAGGARSR